MEVREREVERCSYVDYIVYIKGDQKVFFGKKGEAGSASTLKRRLERDLLDASFIIEDCWNGGQMFYDIDGYFYTVEKISNLTEDSVKESEFRQKLTELISSMGLEVVSIKGDFHSQSEETLIEIEEERDEWLRQEMGIY